MLTITVKSKGVCTVEQEYGMQLPVHDLNTFINIKTKTKYTNCLLIRCHRVARVAVRVPTENMTAKVDIPFKGALIVYREL